MSSRRITLLVIAALALSVPTAWASALPAAPAPTDDTALQARLDTLVEALEAQRTALHIPGMALVIVKDDEILLAHGFGLADVENETPVTPETLFAIGSSSKAFTTALISMLVTEGRMDWDAPITDYLPFFELDVDSDDPDAVVTVRDLVTHRTGFTRMGLLWAGGRAPRQEVLEVATDAEPWDGFRKNFHYNNVMFLAAGVAAARVADTDYDTLLKERLLAPLKMTSSNSSVAASQSDPRLSLGYRWDKDREEFVHLPMRSLDTIAPAGAINSNVLDMAQWLRLQLGDGVIDGERLIAADQIEEMRTPQITMGPGTFYGLGWMLSDWHGLKVVEHGGNIDGFAAGVALMPEERLGFVLLTNVTSTPLQFTARGMVWDAVLSEGETVDSTAEASPDVDAADTVETVADNTSDEGGDAPGGYEQYFGEYIADYAHFDKTPFTVQMNPEGKLAINIPGQMLFELAEPDAEGRWEFAVTDTIAVTFERDAAGDVQSIKLHQGGAAFECPRRDYIYPLDFPLSEVAPLVGHYDDPALGAQVEVLVRLNRLAVDVPGQTVFMMYPPDEDGIWWFRAVEGLGLQFDVEGDGPARSFTFHERGSKRVCTRVETEQQARPDEEAVLALCKLDERREALATLGALRLSGSVRMAQSGVTGSFTWTVDGLERYHAGVDFGLFAQIEEAYADGVGTERSTLAPFKILLGTDLLHARQDNPLMAFTDWSSFCDSYEVAGTATLDGRPVIRVRLTTDGLPPMTLFIDAETGDTLKLTGKRTVSDLGMELPYSVRFENYRDVQGLRIPLRVVSSDDQSGNVIMELEDIESGVEVDDETYVLAR